jgi:hypothetical protein
LGVGAAPGRRPHGAEAREHETSKSEQEASGAKLGEHAMSVRHF